MNTLAASIELADLQTRVLERVKQNRERALLAFYNEEDDVCPSCGAPLYDNEPCCEGTE